MAQALIVAAVCLPVAAPSVAKDGDAAVIWKVEAIQQDLASTALSEFYAAMFNAGQLATREVEVRPGETPTDVMRREGSWPDYLGPSNRLIDAVICDLNRATCNRTKENASGQMLAQVSRNVAATQPSDGNWNGLTPDALLRIPDYKIEKRYETIVTSAAYLARKYGDAAVPVERTGAFAAMYCNLNLSACPRRSALTWEEVDRAPILLFDPSLYVAAPEDDALPKGVLKDFLGAKAQEVMVAVPTLSLRQTVSLPAKGNEAQFGLDDLQRGLSRNVIISRQLRTESAVALQALNRVYLDRMDLDPTADRTDSTDGQPFRQVTVYHFDRQAKLKHCLFDGLTGVQLFEWRHADDGGVGGPVEVAQDGTVSDCTLTEGTASVSLDHGTHTLGLLVSQLEYFASQLPASDVPYFNVVHVPLAGSVFEIDTATGDPFQIEAVMSGMWGAWPKPDVVSMSLSWPAGEVRILDEQILRREDLTAFVVAAPQQEAINECARSPAGIKHENGEFAQNVISVVGLQLSGADGHPTVALLEGAGAGHKCHEIGAFGQLFGPIGDTNAVGQLSGSSQATPVVAATVAELIRRLPVDPPSPRRIGFRLVSTGWFSPDMIGSAKATLLESGTALRTEEDEVVLSTGCRAFGQFVSIKDASRTKRDNYIFRLDDDSLLYIKGKDDLDGERDGRQLLSFRNVDDTRVIVVYIFGGQIHVELGRRAKGIMDPKVIQFAVDRVDGGQGTCDGVDLQRQYIPIADIDQLIIRKLGQ